MDDQRSGAEKPPKNSCKRRKTPLPLNPYGLEIQDNDWEEQDENAVYISNLSERQHRFRRIMPGSVASLEKRLGKPVIGDVPEGDALSGSITQLCPKDRTDEYKAGVLSSYNIAAEDIRSVYNHISEGNTVSYNYLYRLMETFTPSLMIDKSMLLNFSNLQPSAGDYLYHHVLNSCLIALNIAMASDYSKAQIIEIGCSALLMDIGMMLVPEEIRSKSGELTSEEQFEVFKHPVTGYDLLSKLGTIPEPIKIGVYQHHERNNKTGYPKGRGRRLIHSYAKIAGISDVYSALIAPRAYRKGFKPYDAMKIIIRLANRGILDLEHIKNFISCMSLFPIGSFVKLQSGKIGKVINAHKEKYNRPVVSVIFDEHEEVMGENGIYQVDLADVENEKIIGALGKPKSQESIMIGF
ncbi:HD-GYP domain-containing protein, partial [Fibrobacterota bacterium]